MSNLRSILRTAVLLVLFQVVFAAHAVVAQSSAASAEVEADGVEFLHALQSHDYYDLATDYLSRMKEKGTMSAELADLWDLEMSRCLMELAQRAYNEEESKRLLDEAQIHLRTFLNDKPNHPEAYRSLTIWGDFASGSARRALAKIEIMNDTPPSGAAADARSIDEQRDEQLAEAKKQLTEAKSRYADALKQLTAKTSQMPGPPPVTGSRPTKAYIEWVLQKQSLEDATAQARFQLAIVDFLTAQTMDPKYTGEKNDTRMAARRALYESAAEQFNAIFQEFRVSERSLEITLIGLVSHRWEGKCWLEMGDNVRAQDILDEVLANYRPGISDRLRPLFADTQYDLFRIMQKTKNSECLARASGWVSRYGDELGNTEGYQAIAWIVAEAKYDLLKNASGNQVAVPVVEQGKNDIFERIVSQNVPKARLEQELNRLLSAMVKVGSPYQKRAFALRMELSGASSGDGANDAIPSIDRAQTFAEAITIGNSHAERREWAKAEEAFVKAVSLGNSDKTQIDDAKDLALRMQVMQANELLTSKEYTKCLTMMERAWKANRSLPSSTLAAMLAMQSAFGLQGEAQDTESRMEAKEKLESIAKEIMQIWPEKPVADDARLILGRAALSEAFADPGKPDDARFQAAIGFFEQVNPLSERHASSLSTMALAYWQRYLTGKTLQEPEIDQTARRNSAMDFAQKAKDAAITQSKALSANQREAMSSTQFDTQFLLGEIAMEGNDAAAALEQLRPLVDAIAADPASKGQFTNAVLLTATRAFLEQGDVDGAAKAALVLVDSGADTPVMNRTLVAFARQLDVQRKQAGADLIRAASDAEKQDARTKVQRAEEMMGRVLVKLTSRTQLTIGDWLTLAELCTTASQTTAAKAIYEQLIADSATDPRAVTRARAQLAGLLRIEKKFQEAFAQVETLLKENDKAFEPRVEKARILQEWAVSDNNMKLFDDAASEWIRLRNQLQSVRGQKPPEFFEINYNAAACLYQQAVRTASSTPDKAREKMISAKQLLQGTLVMNRALDGPDRVAQYQQQIQKIDDFLKASPR